MDKNIIIIKSSNNILNNSINFVKTQIQQKNSSSPYLANTDMIQSVYTDMNTFPYHRFYRGNSRPNPTIFNREAGYHYREEHKNNITPYNSLSELKKDIQQHTPNVCFVSSTRSTPRCFPEKDTEKNNIKINKQIIQNISQ